MVIITTKSGKKGQGTVTYNGKVGFGFLNRKLDLLDADEYMRCSAAPTLTAAR